MPTTSRTPILCAQELFITVLTDCGRNRARLWHCLSCPGAWRRAASRKPVDRPLPGTLEQWPAVTGGMAERFKAPVLKTGVGASSPWVRIPLPPPERRQCTPVTPARKIAFDQVKSGTKMPEITWDAGARWAVEVRKPPSGPTNWNVLAGRRVVAHAQKYRLRRASHASRCRLGADHPNVAFFIRVHAGIERSAQ